ncbi:MAG: TonB-dependent receptor [uncultured Cytophagales bacterium]|uniref:TonB-dependent receptor n=2 Tax=uncultured Cytophagales bacterium TaxID=158755 RepID=A0A6J4KA28_9SPHI|nr:MAG: TonB-dependent receptor [uncultured Cytophagales bacterium]
MNRFTRLFLFLILSLAGTFRTSGQAAGEQTVSGNFSGTPFPEFVRAVESATRYRFFYDARQADTLKVTVQADARPLRDVLFGIFKGTNYFFAIDDAGRVFVTYDRVIMAGLPPRYFERTEGGEEEAPVAGYLGKKEEAKLSVTAENRLIQIGTKPAGEPTGNANLAGHVRNAASGEAVIGAVIYIENPRVGVSTDQFGYFSLTIPKGRHELKIKSIGMKDTKRQLVLYADGKLTIEMYDDVIPLREVVIEAEKDVNVSGMQMGLERLDIKAMKQVPTALGEYDIFKVVQTLPGVKTVGESSNGLNVRGGATDQNLILYNDAVVYNPTHLFGFFSAFNPDVLKNVELYKSGIPSRYGGRLSSVMEVTTRDGNKKKFEGAGGLGLVTGRLSLEGPIIKDKTSFLIAGRSTYSNWLLKQLRDPAFRKSSASFYDVNLHVSHQMNEKNTFYLTGYLSRDAFQLRSDTLYGYKNQNAVAKWKHIFGNKLYGVFTGSYSRYQYTIDSDLNPVNAYKLNFDINQSNLKADFNFFPVPKHTVDFGVSSIFYKLFPGSFLPKGGESEVTPNVVPAEQGLESAFYIGDKYDISPRLSVSMGLRYSLFNYLGPQQVYTYPLGLPREETNVRDSVSYGRGKNIRTYHGPEYRLSARYTLTGNSSVKMSYNRTRQYIHMLSNTQAIAPTDIWKLSDVHIRPQVGDQYAIGYYRNLKDNTVETSVEAYYKTMDNVLDYKSGADLIVNQNIEQEIINAQGKAYGVEILVKKLTGRVNGWVSYTYSRSLLRMQDPLSTELVNGGRYYPSNFDKPHDFTFIGNYRFNKRASFSLNMTYSTGRPITLPLGKFEIGNAKRVFYSERNQYRIRDYFRTDFSLNVEGNHRVRKLSHSSWTFAVYNLTGRKNPFSVFFRTENGAIKGYELSIFGQPIPTITYNFRF